jgi:hypothetical protein
MWDINSTYSGSPGSSPRLYRLRPRVAMAARCLKLYATPCGSLLIRIGVGRNQDPMRSSELPWWR